MTRLEFLVQCKKTQLEYLDRYENLLYSSTHNETADPDLIDLCQSVTNHIYVKIAQLNIKIVEEVNSLSKIKKWKKIGF